jgi:O-antigen/teichoic acid export membrane protein
MNGQIKQAVKKDSFGSDALLVMLVKVVGAVMTIALSIYITRVIGKGAYGLISLGNQILNYSLLFILAGYNQITTREVSKIREDETQVAFYASMLHRYILSRSAIMMLILFIAAYPLFNALFDSPSFVLPFMILALGLVPQTVSRIFSSVLLGMKKVWQANLTEQTLTSALLLIFLFALNLLGVSLDIYHVVSCFVLARLFMYVIFTLYLKTGLNLNVGLSNHGLNRITKQSGFNSKISRRSFLLIALTSYSYNTINSLVLGFIATPVDVGIFNILMKIATPIAFILIAFQRSSMPRIAKKYAEGDIEYLKQAFLKIGLLAGVLGLLFFILVFLFGQNILLIWNIEEYEVYKSLIILAFGFLINAATSVAGPILAMTGQEGIHSVINMVSVVLQITLSFVLTVNFGIIGAATSFTISMLFSNLAKVFYMYKKVLSPPNIMNE